MGKVRTRKELRGRTVSKSSLCRMFDRSQLDFSAIPVSMSAASLTSRQIWHSVNSKRRLQRIKNLQEGKRHQKKRHLDAFVFVPSVFGDKFPTAE
jgi:hypothetical protein